MINLNLVKRQNITPRVYCEEILFLGNFECLIVAFLRSPRTTALGAVNALTNTRMDAVASTLDVIRSRVYERVAATKFMYRLSLSLSRRRLKYTILWASGYQTDSLRGFNAIIAARVLRLSQKNQFDNYARLTSAQSLRQGHQPLSLCLSLTSSSSLWTLRNVRGNPRPLTTRGSRFPRLITSNHDSTVSKERKRER